MRGHTGRDRIYTRLQMWYARGDIDYRHNNRYIKAVYIKQGE